MDKKKKIEMYIEALDLVQRSSNVARSSSDEGPLDGLDSLHQRYIIF